MSFLKGIAKVAGNVGRAVGKAAKDTEKATVKAAVDTGHRAGAIASSKIGQAALGIGLAASGIGAPLAVGIGAGVKGGANLIKKGGNLKSAATGAGQGALLGAGSAAVGAGVRAVKSGTGMRGFAKSFLGKQVPSDVPASAIPMVKHGHLALPQVPDLTQGRVPRQTGGVMVSPPEHTPVGIKKTVVDNVLTGLSGDAPKGTPTDNTPPGRRMLNAGARMLKDQTGKTSARSDASTVDDTPGSAGVSLAGQEGPTTEPSNHNMILAAAAVGVIVLLISLRGRR